MKKACILLVALFILMTSCDGGLILLGKSTVNVDVSPLFYNEDFEDEASRAALLTSGQTITLTAQGEGFETITRNLSKSLTTSFTVPRGKEITISIEAKDKGGRLYVKGSTTKTMVEATEAIAITLAPVLDDSIKTVTDFYLLDMRGSAGNVKVVRFKPTIPEDFDFAKYGVAKKISVSITSIIFSIASFSLS